MTRFDREYRRIARSLSRVDLMRRSMDLVLAPDDIDPHKQSEDRRFLDFYSEEGLMLALERYGLFAALERRGYRDFALHTRADDERHTLLVAARADALPDEALLVELVVRRDTLLPNPPPGLPPLGQELEALTVDWLTLRHPLGTFTRERPRLPGQEHPGLGVGERVLTMLYRVVERLGLTTLANVPEYFHNAVLYIRELPFFDPWYAGQLRSLERLLMFEHGLSLAAASWAIEWGHVRRNDGTVFRWRGQLMLWPKPDGLEAYFESRAYRREVDRVSDHERYTLDREAFDRHFERERDALEGEREGEPDVDRDHEA